MVMNPIPWDRIRKNITWKTNTRNSLESVALPSQMQFTNAKPSAYWVVSFPVDSHQVSLDIFLLRMFQIHLSFWRGPFLQPTPKLRSPTKSLTSWELTYPLPKILLSRWLSFFQWWDMLVSWRVVYLLCEILLPSMPLLAPVQANLFVLSMDRNITMKLKGWFDLPKLGQYSLDFHELLVLSIADTPIHQATLVSCCCSLVSFKWSTTASVAPFWLE